MRSVNIKKVFVLFVPLYIGGSSGRYKVTISIMQVLKQSLLAWSGKLHRHSHVWKHHGPAQWKKG